MSEPAVTTELAEFILSKVDIPDEVIIAGRRSFVNIVGCALGGVHHPASNLAFEVNQEIVGKPICTLIGRGRVADPLSAAYLNSFSGSAHAFDDTHLSTVLHPSAPISAALFAVSERLSASSGVEVSGERFLEAFILGIEMQCRIGIALLLPPAEGQLAWYASGIVGGISAAAASSRLLNLTPKQTRWAIGIAANQSSGFRQTHGTMCTSFTPGHAARSGLHAALLAERGFTASDAALEGENGYFDVFSKKANPAAAVTGLGKKWHVLDNAFKPYPCGIVIHPVLDACLALARERRFTAEDIIAVEVEVNPLCLMLCDRPKPTGNQLAQVSVQHWSAAALSRGKAGLVEGTDESVHDPIIVGLRNKVIAMPNGEIAPDGAIVTLKKRDGSTSQERVVHCTGSAKRPMTDLQLSDKFMDQSTPILGPTVSEGFLEHCWSIQNVISVEKFLEESVPR